MTPTTSLPREGRTDSAPPAFSGGRRAQPIRRLQVLAVVIPSLLLTGLVALDYYVLERLFPPFEAHLAMLLAGLAGVIAFSIVIFARLAELNARLARQNERLVLVTHDLQRRSDQLRLLSAAGNTLSSEVARGRVLQKVAELAREVAGARYAAFAAFDEDGALEAFHTAGLTDEERERVARQPEAIGLLGLAARRGAPFRVADVTAHPDAAGFPEGHPRIRSFLAVPLVYQGRALGHLYVGEKEETAEFTAEDEEVLGTLAAKAAIALENARLLDEAQKVAALEERHRIGMDLHDGAMQSLYGLSLLIEDAAERIEGEPRDAKEVLAKAVDRLNATIADLRSYVLGLKPPSMDGTTLRESLESIAESARESALLDVVVDVRPDAERALDPKASQAVFYIAADALTNVTRHARAHHAEVRLAREDGSIVLSVKDDGVGFDANLPGGGHGLPNMAERARTVGGGFRLETAPGAGTLVRVSLPVATLSM